MIAEILTAVGSAESAKNIVQDLRGLAEQQKFSELVKRIADLDLEMAKTERLLTQALRESDLLDRKNLELEKENLNLQKEIISLQDNSSNLSLSVKADGLYYCSDHDSPFCPNCYANGNITLLSIVGTGRLKIFSCPTCEWKRNLV